MRISFDYDIGDQTYTIVVASVSRCPPDSGAYSDWDYRGHTDVEYEVQLDGEDVTDSVEFDAETEGEIKALAIDVWKEAYDI